MTPTESAPMPDVEAARMAFVSHIARLTLTNEGGGIDGPAVRAYRALEAALTARAQAHQIERLIELEARGVRSPDLLAAIEYLRAALKEVS